MSIFNKHKKMRKTNKFDFGKFLKSTVTPVEQETLDTVIDRGWLL